MHEHIPFEKLGDYILKSSKREGQDVIAFRLRV